MRKSREIGKLNRVQSLVEILDENDKPVEWVVCSNYEATRPFGSQWDWGHYFQSLIKACNYIAEHVREEAMKEIKKITYAELCSKMYQFNSEHGFTGKGNKESIKGVIVFTEDSFNKLYSLESRSYVVSSDNKAWIPGMGGYSIFGSALDGTDNGIRLEQYMWAEKGGENGWKVDYCYMLEE